ncbi:M48 family metallopeptidase [Mycobacterium branderi]|uniref:Peptidase M48 n=1 Tax=Mycobacterium branderi TaxID=43348 RepID=A0A7I7WEW5_9MYCO|nr:M48 family metallopeptidase [Mycobacterium branderi]MCV7235279.1 M48 family metallopeptidase [Mycobacterium branderi]ORA29875.1 peptidase M48 [Mycobacterium branderi]BBZ15053.1 Zn-dependent protease [Mycobacterium branderi]
MDFFERQRQVRAASKRLVFLFVLAVLGITAMVNVAVIGATTLREPATPAQLIAESVLVSGAVLLMIAAVSTVKTLMLRQGGGVKVAESLGAIRVPDMPTDPRLKRYRNVVEEIAIASSTPVPVLYYLPDESGINAFAAGYTPADAAVCVTGGSLERLNRDELQGVIAHEFSHIVNGDMRLSLKLIGVLAGITALSVIGRMLWYSGGGRGRDRGNSLPLWALGLVVLAAGWIGVFFGRLIKAAVSRQREYLADASAVQFTRQTSGLAGALKKIGGLEAGSRLHTPKAENVSHMLFGEGMKLSALYATHPPLIDRIRALEPGFTPTNLEELRHRWSYQPPDGLAEDSRLGFAEARGPHVAPRRFDPREYTAAVGNPSVASYQAGVRMREAIPPEVARRAHDPAAAVPLIYGLVFDRKQNIRQIQHGIVARCHGPQIADEAWRCGAELARLDPSLRLPVASIAFPALRALPEPPKRLMMSVLGQLINADGQIEVFEYCLGTLVFVGLNETLTSAAPWKSRRQTLTSAQNAICCLLAVLAQAGNSDPRQAAAAFQAGIRVAYPQARIPFLPVDGVLALEQVWPVIDGLEGTDKATVVAAVMTTVTADRVVTVEESELARTVCAVLHCPVPPAL